jgi:hypothetical protein
VGSPWPSLPGLAVAELGLDVVALDAFQLLGGDVEPVVASSSAVVGLDVVAIGRKLGAILRQLLAVAIVRQLAPVTSSPW